MIRSCSELFFSSPVPERVSVSFNEAEELHGLTVEKVTLEVSAGSERIELGCVTCRREGGERGASGCEAKSATRAATRNRPPDS